MPKPWCFNHYSFVVVRITVHDAFNFVLFFIVLLLLFLDFFDYSGFFMVPYRFEDCSSSLKNAIGTLIWIAQNL